MEYHFIFGPHATYWNIERRATVRWNDKTDIFGNACFLVCICRDDFVRVRGSCFNTRNLLDEDVPLLESEYFSSSEEEIDEMAKKRNRKRHGHGGNAGYQGGPVTSSNAVTTTTPETLYDPETARRMENARLAQLADLGNARAQHIRTVDKTKPKAVDAAALAATRAALQKKDGWAEKADTAAALAVWGNMKEDDASDDDGTAGQAHRAEMNRRLHGIQGTEDLARLEARRDSHSTRGGRTSRGGRGGGFVGSHAARKQSMTVNEDGTFDLPIKGRRGAVGLPSPLRAGAPRRGEPMRHPQPAGRNARPTQERPFLDVALSQQSRPQPVRRSMPAPQPRLPEQPAMNLMSNDEFMARVMGTVTAPTAAPTPKPQNTSVTPNPEVRINKEYSPESSIQEDSPEPDIQKEESPEPEIKKEESPESDINKEDSPEPDIKEEAIGEPRVQAESIKEESDLDASLPETAAPIKEESTLGTPFAETSHHVDKEQEPTGSEEFEGESSEEEGSASTVQPPPATAAADTYPDIDQFSSITGKPRDADTIGKELDHEEFVLGFFARAPKDPKTLQQLQYTRAKISELKIELFDCLRRDPEFRSFYSEAGSSHQATSNASTTKLNKQTTNKARGVAGKGDVPKIQGDLLSLSPEKGGGPAVTASTGSQLDGPSSKTAVRLTQGSGMMDSIYAPKAPIHGKGPSVADLRLQSRSVPAVRGRRYSQEEMLELRGARNTARPSSKSPATGVYVHPDELPDRPITASEIVALGAGKGSRKSAEIAPKRFGTMKAVPAPEGFLNVPIKSRNVEEQDKHISRSISPKSPAPRPVAKVQERVPHPLKGLPASALPPHLRHLAADAPRETKNTKVSKEDPQVTQRKDDAVASMSTTQGPHGNLQSPKPETDLTTSTVPMQESSKRNSEILMEEMGGATLSLDGEEENPSYSVQSEAKTTIKVKLPKPAEAQSSSETVQPKPKARPHAVPIVQPTPGPKTNAGQATGLAASAHAPKDANAGHQGIGGAGLEGSIYSREIPQEEDPQREYEMRKPVGHLFQGYNEKKNPKGHQIPAWLMNEMQKSKPKPASTLGTENKKPETAVVESTSSKENKKPDKKPETAVVEGTSSKENKKPDKKTEAAVVERDVSRGRKRTKNPFIF